MTTTLEDEGFGMMKPRDEDGAEAWTDEEVTCRQQIQDACLLAHELMELIGTPAHAQQAQDQLRRLQQMHGDLEASVTRLPLRPQTLCLWQELAAFESLLYDCQQALAPQRDLQRVA